MPSLKHMWTIIFFANVFHISSALEFAPTSTRATRQTSALSFDGLPTIAPGAFHGDLKERSTNQQNPICGWIEGNGASAVSCRSDFYCATESSFVGCCATSSCAGIVTACYDILGSICDASCQHDIGNLVCSSTLPYCATYNYEGGSVGYGCAVARGYTVSVLLSTTTSDGGQLTLASSSSSSSTTNPSPTSSGVPTTTVTSTTSKSRLGGGPIAGIVIGSVAAVASIAFLVFWILRTRRKHREEIQTILQQQQNPYQLQDRTSYRTPQYPGTIGSYPAQDKDGLIPGSPPLSETVASPYGSNFSRTPRNSQPVDYIGPTMPEMQGELEYGRARREG